MPAPSRHGHAPSRPAGHRAGPAPHAPSHRAAPAPGPGRPPRRPPHGGPGHHMPPPPPPPGTPYPARRRYHRHPTGCLVQVLGAAALIIGLLIWLFA